MIYFNLENKKFIFKSINSITQFLNFQMKQKDQPVDKKRFLMLGILSLAQVTNAAAWVNFSAVSDILQVSYAEATYFWVTYLSMIFYVTYLFLSIVSAALIETKGIRYALIVAVVMQTLGFWLRTLVNYHFSFCIIGQTIISLGQPMIINMCSTLSANWFPPRERVVSTMTA